MAGLDGWRRRVHAWWTTNRTRLEPASVMWLWWCAALLAHYDDREHWRVAAIITASVVAAVLGMFVTRSPFAMLAVGALQLAAVWRLLPNVDNHWAFAGFVDLVLVAATLAWMLRKWIATRRIGPLDDDWYRIAAPIVRLLVLVMYAFAVFHKLNTGFLAPETSCAVHFYHRITVTPLVPLFPGELSDAQGRVVVASVLALEAAIPVLLFGRRTWFLGIAAGIVFHLSTGMIMRHYPSIMLALYWVFVPTAVQRRWLRVVDGWIRRATRERLGYVGAVITQALALSLAAMIVHYSHAPKPADFLLLRAWNVVVVVGGIVAVVAFVRIGGAIGHPPGRFRSREWWLYSFVVLFTLNCMSPYLGLKTVTSINMWSNLVVTGPESNHVLVPTDALRVFDYTGDVVTVRKSSDKELNKLARAQKKVSWLKFRHAVQQAVRRANEEKRKLSLTFVRDGETVKTKDAAKDPTLMDRGSFFERKLVNVKATHGKNPERCEW